MLDAFVKLVVGDLDDKKVYQNYRKRVTALPMEYRRIFKKMEHYLNYIDLSGCDMSLYINLLELMEACVVDHKSIQDVMGSDVATFCDEFVAASAKKGATTKEKFNQEILEHFHREVK